MNFSILNLYFYFLFSFEEMRMRYERRDPRPEDLRDIEELKSRIESQDRDLCKMTEKLREYQMNSQQKNQPANQQQQTAAAQRKQKNKGNSNSNNKSKVNNCNVIYEENEEREASPNGVYFAKSVDM